MRRRSVADRADLAGAGQPRWLRAGHARRGSADRGGRDWRRDFDTDRLGPRSDRACSGPAYNISSHCRGR